MSEAKKLKTATKFDAGKPDVTLVESDYIVGIAKIMDYYTKIHGRDFWKSRPGLNKNNLCSIIIENILKFNDGENIHNSINVPIMDYIAFIAMMLAYVLENKDTSSNIEKVDTDDIFKSTVDLTLVNSDFILNTAIVLGFGEKKYGRNNWKDGGGFKFSRLMACLLRHVFSIQNGDLIDEESGQLHIYHVSCNIMFIQYTIKHYAQNDDRYIIKKNE